MATLRGKDGVVKAGATPTVVGEVQSWSLDQAATVSHVWSMGDTAQRAQCTAPPAGSGSVEVYLDDTDAGQALLIPGAELALELYPGGETSGTGYFSLTAVIESVGASVAKDGTPTRSVAFKANGAVTGETVT